MLHMTKTFPPPTRPPRVSVPVDAETLAVFERLAKAGNMSTGRAMAEWLKDTMEGAEMMASTMERARAAPKLVTAELHAMVLGLADNTKELMDKFGKLGKAARSDGRVGDALASHARPSLRAETEGTPPSCNTGGKVTGAKKPNTKRGAL
jgi:hypothetical protein